LDDLLTGGEGGSTTGKCFEYHREEFGYGLLAEVVEEDREVVA